MDELGLEEASMGRLIRAGYRILGLVNFFDCRRKGSVSSRLLPGLAFKQETCPYQSLASIILSFISTKRLLKGWTCQKGDDAPTAAGKIHSDMEKGFIRMEVIFSVEQEMYRKFTKLRFDLRLRVVPKGNNIEVIKNETIGRYDKYDE